MPFKKKERKSSVPSFLKKLFEIISQGKHLDIIAWGEDGQYFEVKNREQFKESILPTYFKHNNLNSFIR